MAYILKKKTGRSAASTRLQVDKEQCKHTPYARKAAAAIKLKQSTVALTVLPEIPADELQITRTHLLGEGCFGKYTVATYKQCYNSDSVDESHLLQEAHILA